MDVPEALVTYIDELGRMTRIPARLAKQRQMAIWLASEFEFGREYSEPEVNEILQNRVSDYAFVRRLMISMGLMKRDLYGYVYTLASDSMVPSP
jgi:hypothetical protein